MDIAVLQINEKTFDLCAGNIYFIGRNTSSYLNDVNLNENSVDYKHAAIDFRKNHISIVDMNSTSGTYVDNIQLEKLMPQVVSQTCNIKFGYVSGLLTISNNCQSEFNKSNKQMEANSSNTSNVIDCSLDISGSKSNGRYMRNKLQNIPPIQIESNICLVEAPVEKQNNSHLSSPDEEEIDMFIPETQELFDKTNNHSEQFRICTQEFNYMADSSKDSEYSDICPVFVQNHLDSIKIIVNNDDGNGNNKNDDVNMNTPDLSETFSRKRLSTILSMSDISSTLDSDLDFLNSSNKPIDARKSLHMLESTEDELNFNRNVTVRKKRTFRLVSSDEDSTFASTVKHHKSNNETELPSKSPSTLSQESTSTSLTSKLSQKVNVKKLSISKVNSDTTVKHHKSSNEKILPSKSALTLSQESTSTSLTSKLSQKYNVKKLSISSNEKNLTSESALTLTQESTLTPLSSKLSQKDNAKKLSISKVNLDTTIKHHKSNNETKLRSKSPLTLLQDSTLTPLSFKLSQKDNAKKLNTSKVNLDSTMTHQKSSKEANLPLKSPLTFTSTPLTLKLSQKDNANKSNNETNLTSMSASPLLGDSTTTSVASNNSKKDNAAKLKLSEVNLDTQITANITNQNSQKENNYVQKTDSIALDKNKSNKTVNVSKTSKSSNIAERGNDVEINTFKTQGVTENKTNCDFISIYRSKLRGAGNKTSIDYESSETINSDHANSKTRKTNKSLKTKRTILRSKENSSKAKPLNNQMSQLEGVSDPVKEKTIIGQPLSSLQKGKSNIVSNNESEDSDFINENSKQFSTRNIRGKRVTAKLTSERSLRTKRSKLANSIQSSQESHSIISRSESDLSINFGNRTLRKKFKVIFSKIDPKDYMDNIRSLGLQIVKDPRSADILITNNTKRTYKFLIALVRGIPVVSINWLETSISDKTISMSFEDYYITDKDMEKQFKFNLSTSIKLAQNRKLFDGYQFLMTTNIKPAPKEMKDIIECGGGKILQKVSSANDNPDNVLVLISNVEDQKRWSQYKKLDHIKIVQDEGILISILQQKIQFDKYLLV